MLVTILINNYNYGRFLREAIDSALNQSYPHCEVIVVDDGSTDDSREIIASYGNRIIPVLKENGGQASAVNAGFAVSRGEIVCFLDSDDVFLPEKVSVVLRAWEEIPDACVVYHQLQAINTQKEKIGNPWPRAVWRGDIRHRVERSGGWWPYPTTSGLCFSPAFLERLLPMPTEPCSFFPDTYFAGPAAFFSPVLGLRASLALSRFHGQNNSTLQYLPNAQVSPERRLETLQRSLNQQVAEFEMLNESLNERLKIPVSISLNDHFLYQRLRRATGAPLSLSTVLLSAISCPALPVPMKLREVARIALDRW